MLDSQGLLQAWQAGSYADIFLAACTLIVIVMASRQLSLCLLSDPGYVSGNRLECNPSANLCGLVRWDICDDLCVCDVHNNEIPFTYHGSNGDCIFKYDHSCSWIGNDIGFLNRAFFIKFVVMLWAENTLMLIFIIRRVYTLTTSLGFRCFELFLAQNIGSMLVKELLISLFANFISWLVSAVTACIELFNTFTGHTIHSRGVRNEIIRSIKTRFYAVAQTSHGYAICGYGSSKEELDIKKASAVVKRQCCYPDGLRQVFREGKFYRRQ